MKFALVDIDTVWPAIASRAARVLDESDATGDNVREECREGRALCFVCEDGVLVVTLIPNRIRSDFELFVWLAVSWGEPGVVERHDRAIDEIAQELGASRVKFCTRRRGWEKRLGPNWRLASITYEREVGDHG